MVTSTRRYSLRPSRKSVVVILATLLVAGACGGGETTDGSGLSPATAARQDIDADEFVSVLADAGVTIVDTDGAVVVAATEPAGPLKLTEWQAAALAREADVGVGIAAGNLEALAGEFVPGAPLSSILAGYLISADTPGGAWASRHIASFDLDSAAQVEYPAAVLILFVAEMTRPWPVEDLEAATEEADAVLAVLRPAHSSDPAAEASLFDVPVPDVGCGLFAGQVNAMLTEIFTFLATKPPIPLPEWLSAAGLDLIALQLALEWSQFIPDVAKALAVLLTVSMITAVVGSWSMSVTPSANSDRFSVGSEEPRAQSFTADLAGSPAWPPGMGECAATAGIVLPDPTGSGTTATWEVTGFPQFGVEDERDNAFDDQGLARLSWHTGHEDSDAGQVQIGIVSATVRPDPAFRESLVKTATAALKQLVNQSGPLVTAIGIVMPEVNDMVASAGLLIAQHASAEVEVQYHSEDCLTGTWVSVAYRATDQDTMGGVGSVTLVITDGNHGSVTFDPGAPVFSRTLGPDDLWVKMELNGSYTFTIDDAGMLQHTGGNAYLTPYVDLGGGWIQTSNEPLLITEGGAGSMIASTYECSGSTLIVRSPYSEFEFGKVN